MVNVIIGEQTLSCSLVIARYIQLVSDFTAWVFLEQEDGLLTPSMLRRYRPIEEVKSKKNNTKNTGKPKKLFSFSREW